MTVVRVKNRLAEDYEAHSTAGKPQILGPALSIMSVETLTLSSTRTENLYLNSKRTKTLNPKLDLEFQTAGCKEVLINLSLSTLNPYPLTLNTKLDLEFQTAGYRDVFINLSLSTLNP